MSGAAGTGARPYTKSRRRLHLPMTTPPIQSTSASTATASVREELALVAQLATPIILVQVGMMLMGAVDTMMLGRLDALALAAGALGNTVSFGLLVPAMGILFALDPLVSQAYGAGDQEAVKRHFQRGLVLATLLSVPLSAIMLHTAPLLELLGQKEEVVPLAAEYIRGLVPGNVAFLLFIALRQTLTALGRIRQALWAIVVANLVNVLFNWLLIFGHWGLPRLGVLGSAYATALARWVMVGMLFAVSWRILKPYLESLGKELWQAGPYFAIFGLGVPIALLLSAEMWFFSTVALLIGHLGPIELAAHQIALNLAALSFQVPVGVAAAAAARVGNAIGRRDQNGARRSARVCLVVGACVMSVSAAAFAFLPGLLARLYTPDQAVIAIASILIPVAALFQIFDGLQVVGSGVLRGAADTRIPAMLGLFGYWGIGLPLGWYFAFEEGRGPQGLWWGLTIGLATVALFLLARIRYRFKGEIARVQL
jgi:MATE family multidrug resistance protein